jgi:hypothetical protein
VGDTAAAGAVSWAAPALTHHQHRNGIEPMAQRTITELLGLLDSNPITGVPTMQNVVDAFKEGLIDGDEAKLLQDKVTKREKSVFDDYLRSQGYDAS